MFRIINEPKNLIGNFVASVNAVPFNPGNDFSALGLARDDELISGIIYNGFSWPDILMHIGSVPGRKWLNREFLYSMFAYPFVQLRCQRVTGLIPRKNKDCRRFAEHLGFEFEGKMRRALVDDDLMVYGLLEEKCKWHREEFRARIGGQDVRCS